VEGTADQGSKERGVVRGNKVGGSGGLFRGEGAVEVLVSGDSGRGAWQMGGAKKHQEERGGGTQTEVDNVFVW